MLGQKITPKQLRQRFGNISEMTLWRWLRDEKSWPTEAACHQPSKVFRP